MTSNQRSGFDPTYEPNDFESLHMVVGSIRGSMSEMRSRVDRIENDMKNQLASMDGKLDAQDGKLDAIRETLAERAGQAKGLQGVFRWILAIATTGAAWLGLPHLFGGHS